MSVYFMCYAASYLFALAQHYRLSGLALLLAALHLYWQDYRRTGNLLHLRGLFSLFWVGGEGISCFKLSKLQSDWSLMTWVCFLLALAGFWFTYEFLERRDPGFDRRKKRQEFKNFHRPIFVCMAAVTAVSAAAFALEAVLLGFVPLLVRGVPHAYSAFHITGVHYFTVSCVLVPSLAVLYFYSERGRNSWKAAFAIGMLAVSLAIPILCVSRFQLILAVGLAVFTYLTLQDRMSIWIPLGFAAALAPIYILLTFARGHSISYLNGIFEMKNSGAPIFITQPYIYIANNYDNFNCLTEFLPSHTWGLRMLFPVWALTGLKFLVPSLVDFPIYVTKTELTTVTLFYDAYYDFGVAGVLLFSCALGLVSYLLAKWIRRRRNPIACLFYAQMAIYLTLSFFTTWFSNPATWFYFALTGVIGAYCSFRAHR